jgi:hypothetical protein
VVSLTEIPWSHKLDFFFRTRLLEHQVGRAPTKSECVPKRFSQIHFAFIHWYIANRAFHVLLSLRKHPITAIQRTNQSSLSKNSPGNEPIASDERACPANVANAWCATRPSVSEKRAPPFRSASAEALPTNQASAARDLTSGSRTAAGASRTRAKILANLLSLN